MLHTSNFFLMRTKDDLKFYYYLYIALLKGKKLDKDDGVYLVCFRTSRGSKRIYYQYIYYNSEFLYSLLQFLLEKKFFKSSYTYEKYGDYFTFIDSDLNINPIYDSPYFPLAKKIEITVEYIYLSYYYILNKKFNRHHIHLDNKDPKITVPLDLLNFLKTCNLMVDIEGMTNIIDCLKNKRHYDFLTKHFITKQKVISNKYPVSVSSARKNFNNATKDYYFLDDCLFVVKDIKHLLAQLESEGYKIKKGIKYSKDLSDMSMFLNHVDLDYRRFLMYESKYKLAKMKERLYYDDLFDNLSDDGEYLRDSLLSYQNMRTKLGTYMPGDTTVLVN